jgi:molybdate transport system substrate-binding protein
MRTLSALLAACALALAGCGGGDDDTLTVSAASSLKKPLTDYGGEFEAAKARFSFAGSDELAAQIRKGAKPDVFASANTKLPEELYDEGLVEKPVTFAGNRLVLAVPASADAKIASLRDIERAGTSLAIGSESVPVGSYTRRVLSTLPESESSAILKNVRSEEPDVAGIVGKLTQGAVDAGFVYVSDVRATDGKLKAIELPDSLQPTVAYGVAVIKDAKHEEAAKAFVDGLLDGDGKRALDAAGFEPPPAQ